MEKRHINAPTTMTSIANLVHYGLMIIISACIRAVLHCKYTLQVFASNCVIDILWRADQKKFRIISTRRQSFPYSSIKASISCHICHLFAKLMFSMVSKLFCYWKHNLCSPFLLPPSVHNPTAHFSLRRKIILQKTEQGLKTPIKNYVPSNDLSCPLYRFDWSKFFDTKDLLMFRHNNLKYRTVH